MKPDPIRKALASELGRASWKARRRKYGKQGMIDIFKKAGRKGARKRWKTHRKAVDSKALANS